MIPIIKVIQVQFLQTFVFITILRLLLIKSNKFYLFRKKKLPITENYLLTEKLQSNESPTRIVNVSSLVHNSFDLNIEGLSPDKLEFEQKAREIPVRRFRQMLYSRSKLMVNMFTKELAERLVIERYLYLFNMFFVLEIKTDGQHVH